MKTSTNLALVLGGIAMFFTSMTLINAIEQDILWKKIASGIALLLIVCLSTGVLLSRKKNDF